MLLPTKTSVDTDLSYIVVNAIHHDAPIELGEGCSYLAAFLRLAVAGLKGHVFLFQMSLQWMC